MCPEAERVGKMLLKLSFYEECVLKLGFHKRDAIKLCIREVCSSEMGPAEINSSQVGVVGKVATIQIAVTQDERALALIRSLSSLCRDLLNLLQFVVIDYVDPR